MGLWSHYERTKGRPTGIADTFRGTCLPSNPPRLLGNMRWDADEAINLLPSRDLRDWGEQVPGDGQVS